MKIHQVWFGDAPGDGFSAWMESVRGWSADMGMEYRLWRETELWQVFGHEPEVVTLRRCLEALPSATAYSFASDFWRMRLIAEFGGLYVDADVLAQAAVELPQPGLYCSVERHNPRLLSTWLLWAVGAEGRAAARALWAAARAHFNVILPPGSVDIPSRFVEQVRRDKQGHGADKMGLGPRVFRRVLLPQLAARGWRVEPLPDEVASPRNPHAALRHCNAGSWLEKGADWNARAAQVKQLEVEALPPWLRPQGTRVLPKALRRVHAGRALPPVGDGLTVPKGTWRIVVFSNVPGLDARAVVQPGDFCVHINRARQFSAVADVPGVVHALVVRRGRDKSSGGVMWFDPPSTAGFSQVLHVQDVPMRARRRWWQEYCRENPGKCPTTGFICWHLSTEAVPGIPVVLAGFNPAADCGTYRWPHHAWEYEAAVYEQIGVDIRRIKGL